MFKRTCRTLRLFANVKKTDWYHWMFKYRTRFALFRLEKRKSRKMEIFSFVYFLREILLPKVPFTVAFLIKEKVAGSRNPVVLRVKEITKLWVKLYQMFFPYVIIHWFSYHCLSELSRHVLVFSSQLFFKIIFLKFSRRIWEI